ncbi:MAG: J domain-containing protein [Ilumatobacteraceae bacterium]
MVTNRNLYSVLGVSSGATPEQLREAYRELARRLHPDVAGTSKDDAIRMAEVNHAWSVLSDPVARRDYDVSQRVGSASHGSAVPPSRDGVRGVSRPPQVVPPRFPWRTLIVVTVVAALLVLVAHALTEPAQPGVPDQLLTNGSCVQIDRESFAVEVSCAGPHDGVVQAFVAIDQTCPATMSSHLDRQGMGRACIVLGSLSAVGDSG